MCASARVIKHSRFKAKKRAWKERRFLAAEFFFFFSFFLFGLLSHNTDEIFLSFWIKNLSQILLRIIKVYSFSLLLSNESCDKDECNNTFFVFSFERCYCYRWWWWFPLLA